MFKDLSEREMCHAARHLPTLCFIALPEHRTWFKIEQNERRSQTENMTKAMRHHLFIHLLPEVNKAMLVITTAYVELDGKLLKLYCPNGT